MNFNKQDFKFLISIFPPNYYASSSTKLDPKQLRAISQIVDNLKIETENEFIKLNKTEIKLVILCIQEFLRIADDEVPIVSGYTQDFFLTRIQFLNSFIEKNNPPTKTS